MPRKKYKRSGKKTSGNWQQRDPFFERESQKYEQPAPSREFILEVMQGEKRPLNAGQIAKNIGISEENDFIGLERRLQAMERDGQLICNRRKAYVIVNEEDLVRGRIQAHPDGFGFLIPDEGGEDVFLSPKGMKQVLHGDRAVVNVVGVDHKGRKEGAIVQVLERANKQIVGRIFFEHGFANVVPENKRINQDIAIPRFSNVSARNGEVVVVNIIEQPSRHRPPLGEVAEVLGHHLEPGMEKEIAIRGHGLPHEWNDALLNELAKFPEEVNTNDYQDREDLRKLPFVTIDGEDARDFDDAIYVKKTLKGWKLYVAIADVSTYVTPDSEIDKEALNRGTSVYFPQTVIPMLPEKLSNGLCSLMPKVNRLAMVCEMSVSATGEITRSRFYEALIRSHARLTYTIVSNILSDENSPEREEYAELLPHLFAAYDLYKSFKKRRDRRGAIEFDSSETKLLFNKNGKIERIEPVVRNDAHKLIEECMIAANVCAAKFIGKHKVPGLFRVHEGVKADKLDDLRVFLSQFRLELPGHDKVEPRHYSAVLQGVVGLPEQNLIQTVMLRSMKHAEYIPANDGHFGLALENYAHFTSPIRRYPDLIIHRSIKHIVKGGKPKNYMYSDSKMESLGEHCSMTERRAEEASRDVMLTLKCQFMADHVGNEFEGIVTGVTSFGLFVELQDVFAEGLVHVTELGDDYFQFDAAHHRLIGERTKKVFQLADKVQVKVVRVDVEDKKIDLELLGAKHSQNLKSDEPGARKTRKPKPKTKGKARAKPKPKMTRRKGKK